MPPPFPRQARRRSESKPSGETASGISPYAPPASALRPGRRWKAPELNSNSDRITLITNAAGAVVERFDCDDAGKPLFLTIDYAPSSASSSSSGIRWLPRLAHGNRKSTCSNAPADFIARILGQAFPVTRRNQPTRRKRGTTSATSRSSGSDPLFVRNNPHFPAIRSGHRLFQEPSTQKQIPGSQVATDSPHFALSTKAVKFSIGVSSWT